MKIVTAFSLSLALACVVSVHHADALCRSSKDCTACGDNDVKGGCVWCAIISTIPDESDVMDTTLGFCDIPANACGDVHRIPSAANGAYRSLTQLSNRPPVLLRINTCPAAGKAIGTPINTACATCVAGDNSFCSVVTGYPGSEAPTKTGGFCLPKAKAILCTPATLPMYSKLFPGATLTMSASTKAADCCSLNRTCADCHSALECSWCALELTDGADDNSKHVASGFGICVHYTGDGDLCPPVPPQLSAMTSGLNLDPAVGWATQDIPQRECANEVPAYSTGAWSSFTTRADCNSNPSTAWCDLTGVARTDVAATTPLNSGGICMDLFASGSCHAGWYLYPSPTVGFEMDGSF